MQSKELWRIPDHWCWTQIEEVGLVVPSGRTEGGFRLYTDSDVSRLRLVKALKPIGMSLETLSELLAAVDDLARHSLGAVEVDVRQHHPGASCGQRLSNGLSKARAAARHDRRSTFE